ncbi:MAG: PstS family phosphate ABC transporter substrate-binding protein [Candidatus Porifericomitaceae bacterium WSBS_2022_MAG_OTU9]
MKKHLYLSILSLLWCSPAIAVSTDPDLPEYSAKRGVVGQVISVGSDTLANLMTLWAEDFKKFYPAITVQIQASGSSTAPPALTEGTANLGPMSRRMKSGEESSFEKHFGYKPTAIAVAIDALAVYVHRDNPLEGLDMAQVDAMFSVNRNCGHQNDISSWAQLGLPDLGAIQMFGRNSVSGTYGYFKKVALCKSDYKDTVNEQPGSASVVQSVGRTLAAIGYSGIGYLTSEVRALPLRKGGGDYIAPVQDNIVSGKYPLSRFLYVYVNRHPEKGVEPVVAEFLSMVLSGVGQNVVIKDGYLPLSAAQSDKQIKLISSTW